MRAQLVNDVFSLAQANRLRATRPFELAGYFANEQDYLPWSVLLERLEFYTNVIESTEIYGHLRTYLIGLIAPIYNKLSWSSKPTDLWLTR